MQQQPISYTTDPHVPSIIGSESSIVAETIKNPNDLSADVLHHHHHHLSISNTTNTYSEPSQFSGPTKLSPVSASSPPETEALQFYRQRLFNTAGYASVLKTNQPTQTEETCIAIIKDIERISHGLVKEISNAKTWQKASLNKDVTHIVDSLSKHMKDKLHGLETSHKQDISRVLRAYRSNLSNSRAKIVFEVQNKQEKQAVAIQIDHGQQTMLLQEKIAETKRLLRKRRDKAVELENRIFRMKSLIKNHEASSAILQTSHGQHVKQDDILEQYQHMLHQRDDRIKQLQKQLNSMNGEPKFSENLEMASQACHREEESSMSNAGVATDSPKIATQGPSLWKNLMSKIQKNTFKAGLSPPIVSSTRNLQSNAVPCTPLMNSDSCPKQTENLAKANPGVECSSSDAKNTHSPVDLSTVSSHTQLPLTSLDEIDQVCLSFEAKMDNMKQAHNAAMASIRASTDTMNETLYQQFKAAQREIHTANGVLTRDRRSPFVISTVANQLFTPKKASMVVVAVQCDLDSLVEHTSANTK
ncbi:hypothetical protein BASA81_016359 [Batrachochytrium salamandrivorans]|nr:hypothetical protein BASA81_016359 [Batrachochytrium salamandrivorans]